MTTYRFLLIEESEADQQTLRKLLAQVPLLADVEVCSSTTGAFRLLTQQQYDLVFLDMRLPGLAGLDWLRSSPHRPPVIITTALPDFAVAAYDLDIADYLIKPLSLQRLQRAISRALTIQVSDWSITDSASICLYVDQRLQQFRFTDIQYLEAYGAYTKIHGLQDFSSVNESISAIHDRLPNRQFLRIQKSFVVNTDNLTAVGHRQVWLQDTKLPIGMQYRESVRQLVNRITS